MGSLGDSKTLLNRDQLQKVQVFPMPGMLGNACYNSLTRNLGEMRAWQPTQCLPCNPALARQRQAHYLSISVHQRMSSFSFMKTGKCWSLPCFMEFDLVVMVLTLLN